MKKILFPTVLATLMTACNSAPDYDATGILRLQQLQFQPKHPVKFSLSPSVRVIALLPDRDWR